MQTQGSISQELWSSRIKCVSVGTYRKRKSCKEAFLPFNLTFFYVSFLVFIASCVILRVVKRDLNESNLDKRR